MKLKQKWTSLCLCLAVFFLGTALGKSQPKPKLVVVLVVDQMRSDYIDQFRHQWTGGLRRLLERGAWFHQAAYPYLNTITCSGHATIATGSFPATHGIVLNAWWDRASERLMSCTEDRHAPVISYGAPRRVGHSAALLEVPTLAETLRAKTGRGAHSITFSLKARSAIMLAGHHADAVTWFDAAQGAWMTSSAYSDSPLSSIRKFLNAHPVENDLGKSWTAALPETAHSSENDTAGESPPGGWTTAFPHPIRSGNDKPDALFYALWAQSPFSDAYLGEMAQAAIDAFSLGKHQGTDFLGISFSALDSVGHGFGPRSREVQEMLVQLDATIGKLLEHLERAVGPENYVVVLSADHGVAPIPEQMAHEGVDAGRVVTQEVVKRVEQAIAPVLGPGKRVAQMIYTDLYFAPGVYRKLAANQAAKEAVREAILSVPGIWRAFWSDELASARASDDPVMRAAALSYYRDRSGDLIVVPKLYWFFVESARPGTTHGTLHPYDTRVPVILMGRGIRPGEYLQPATPADIAPTLASLCGITLPRTDGRVLTEALEAPPPSPAKEQRRK